MKKNIVWIIVFLVLAGTMTTVNLVRLYTDWLWFSHLGYQSVFLTILVIRLKLGFALGAVFFVFMILNLAAADRLSRIGYIKVGDNAIELPGSETLGPHIRLIMIVASAFLAFILGVEASGRWDMFIRFTDPTAFGLTEPVFNQDVSFYIFKLPFINYLYQWSLVVIVLATVLAVSVYAYKRGFVITNRGVHFRKTLFGHLSALIALLIALKACGYKIYAFNMLVTSRGFVSGAGYTDLAVRLPLLKALTVIALIVSAALIANIFIRNWKLGAAAIALMLLASGAGAGYPEIVQKLRVVPNEISLEKTNIQRQIDFTRIAYDLDRVEVKPFEAERALSADQIAGNELTIKNIRLWDERPLLQSYRQLQEIRTYYSFTNVDVDRYMIDGEYRQVMLSTRELSYDKLPARIWINEHLAFTHGYGLCMSPVNRFTPEGMPDFIIKDIPPAHTTDLKITQPRIYYGELANDYVFTNTVADEFDYPLGDSNVFSEYNGSGGIVLDSLLKKAAFAVRFSSLATVLNSDIKKDSRIMIYRNILGGGMNPGRANKIMPLISYDLDPYIVVDGDGRLKWILDGYTLSRTFPYSQPFGRSTVADYNYIRNSVKVVMDAYDGSVDYYVFDESDPIIKTYSRMFPGLFHPKSEMPESLRSHVRYPLDLFKVQSRIFLAYQMTDPVVFYNKEDLWATPREIFDQKEQEIDPYYTIMKLPGETREEYILMLPFTPANRDNISAWMCARNDGDRYGQLLVYKFPKKKLIFGPFQIEARIDQDSEISKQLTLWSQGGSQIIRGNLLVIPIEDSIMYVEPLFLKAEKGEIPELKRVIVSIGDKVAMEETLEGAIEKLVGPGTLPQPQTNADGSPQPAAGLSLEQAIRKALDHIEAAKQKIRDLDWSGFGAQIDEAENTLKSIPPTDSNYR